MITTNITKHNRGHQAEKRPMDTLTKRQPTGNQTQSNNMGNGAKNSW